jgi:hypothetical protein
MPPAETPLEAEFRSPVTSGTAQGLFLDEIGRLQPEREAVSRRREKRKPRPAFEDCRTKPDKTPPTIGERRLCAVASQYLTPDAEAPRHSPSGGISSTKRPGPDCLENLAALDKE